jgi:AcrR family transcriptional regulator
MPRTKEQYGEMRQEKQKRIEETALSLFAEKGYKATSISDIAKSAGISKGLMYHYFTSKEELLKMIWDKVVGEFNAIIDLDNDGEITEEEAEFYMDQFFEMCKRNRLQFKLYYQLSFQPEVVSYLTTKYEKPKAAQRMSLILNFFSTKLNFETGEFGYFATLVFIKGLSMVTTYTENVYGNDFLDRFKQNLKTMIFNR